MHCEFCWINQMEKFMNREDGGSAFPEPGHSQCGGMSLRDYFAAKAMQGICAHVDTWGLSSNTKIAAAAYELADAMLAARSA